MLDSVASPSSSSGGRGVSTGCFTGNSWCSVCCTPLSVYSTGKIFHFVCYRHAGPFVSEFSVELLISSVCRFTLTSRQQDLFERIALYCDRFTNTNFIPVSFVLGKLNSIFPSKCLKPLPRSVMDSILFFSFLLL